MLLLTRRDVEGLLSLEDAITAMRDAYRQQASGEVVAHPPFHLPLSGGAALRVLSGGLLSSGRCGVRVGGANTLAGRGTLAVLYDASTAEPLCITAYSFGTLRTAAAIAVATDLQARRDSRSVGLIGSGRNALGILRGVMQVRPVERIRVFSRTPEHRTAFAQRASDAVGRAVAAVDSAEAAVADADIVLVATDAASPVVRHAWLKPGAHVNSMGQPAEIEPATYADAAPLVVGSRLNENSQAEENHLHPLFELTRSGRLFWEAMPELGEVLAGAVPGRTGDSGISLFRESQGGFGDVALTQAAYARALERGLGVQVDL